MTEEHIIKLVDEWIKKEELRGGNCDDTTICNGELICYLEHWDIDGWVRQVYFNIPEYYLEGDIEETEVKDFINRQMIREMRDWANDDEDMYRNIELASYEDDEETAYYTKTFTNGRKRLEKY